MNVNWRTISKWLLVLPTIALSTLAAAIGAELSVLLYRPAIALASALHINIAPSLIVAPLGILSIFLVILLWVLPPAFAVGFALRARWSSCWQWGFTISVLLLAAFAWADKGSYTSIAFRSAVVCAAILLIAERVAWKKKLLPSKMLITAQMAALFVLLTPYLTALLFAQKLPPAPHKLWSVVLQKETWQAMNTGSEYAATRQMVFAGDRVVVVFDSGMAPYKGNQPMSTYRVLSLDQTTGVVRNQMEFTGNWGHMPYLFATGDGQVLMQSGPMQRLKPDLVTVEDSPAPNRSPVNLTTRASHIDDECGQPHLLTENRILSAGCGSIRILDGEGKVIVARRNLERGYTFAGANQMGTRFALQAYDERGDPSFLLYERFFIYDTNSALPIAMIPVSELPERQSWTAFSPDGRFFAVGNPNRLSLYELP